jgi:hypothetical protein
MCVRFIFYSEKLPPSNSHRKPSFHIVRGAIG